LPSSLSFCFMSFSWSLPFAFVLSYHVVVRDGVVVCIFCSAVAPLAILDVAYAAEDAGVLGLVIYSSQSQGGWSVLILSNLV
jgi:hypothetical protein